METDCKQIGYHQHPLFFLNAYLLRLICTEILEKASLCLLLIYTMFTIAILVGFCELRQETLGKETNRV